MKKPNKTLEKVGVGRMTIKYHAHALTLFAVFWSLPSGISVTDRFGRSYAKANHW
ncbi:hypothetical protein CfE428DRAFT_3940 [Chthoniobacter flavus Ellin428]|uniref:Uncharacterized protein n=1 Tax=Chthoniobacter flavus Ellin428 TaxID=497964 RepID=B4D4V2_9BACT|nr:hypothetical protein CfE428DRAFT_3940 [Chthoniobacter flavus Ellin428]TCO90990.1 hypothetical protein EV701_109140 [Chthoniobacter flavus]